MTISKNLISLINILSINPEDENYKEIEKVFKNSKFMNNKEWSKKDFIFRSSISVKINYCSIMITKAWEKDWEEKLLETDDSYTGPDGDLCNPHEKYYVLFLYLNDVFESTSDIRITRTDNHWGIFKDKIKSNIKLIPKDIKENDIEELFRFFDFAIIKKLADHFGF